MNSQTRVEPSDDYNRRLSVAGGIAGGSRKGSIDAEKVTLPYFSELNKTDIQYASISFGLAKQTWLLFVMDLVIIALANFLGTWIRSGVSLNDLLLDLYVQNLLPQYAVALLVTLFFYPLAMYVFDLYSVQRLYNSWETVYRCALSVLFGGILCIVIFYLAPQGQFGRGIMAIQMLLTCFCLTGWRWAYGLNFQTSKRKIPIIIIGTGLAAKVINELLKSPFSPYDVKGFLDEKVEEFGLGQSEVVLGTCEQLGEIAGKVGAQLAILAVPDNRSQTLIKSILSARLKGIEIKEMVDVYEQLTGRIPIRFMADQWLLFAEGSYLLDRDYVQNLKRLIDILISVVLVVTTAPFFVLAALLIRIDSRGPIFYKQKRVGKNQNVFMIYKFRSMHQKAEENGAQWASINDPRITRVGRFFRLTHLDELPQIWNVLKGDMSLVGPRPERPEFVQLLEREIPYYSIRHSIRPGVTGWAQVCYRYGASVDDAFHKAECDLYYLKNMSLFLDFKILLRTMGVVFLWEGSR